jgi:hypothetical protein
MIQEYTIDELKNNVKIYVGKNKTPIKIEKIQDIIPYYPYTISHAGFDNVKRSATIYLSQESDIDYEEEQTLRYYLERIIKIYRRNRRKKKDFTFSEVLSVLDYSNIKEAAYLEIYERVKRDGIKATTDGIHLPTYDYWRKELVEEMIKNNMNPADYGYGRLVEVIDKC